MQHLGEHEGKGGEVPHRLRGALKGALREMERVLGYVWASVWQGRWGDTLGASSAHR
jgi:hypothetical protein